MSRRNTHLREVLLLTLLAVGFVIVAVYTMVTRDLFLSALCFIVFGLLVWAIKDEVWPRSH